MLKTIKRKAAAFVARRVVNRVGRRIMGKRGALQKRGASFIKKAVTAVKKIKSQVMKAVRGLGMPGMGKKFSATKLIKKAASILKNPQKAVAKAKKIFKNILKNAKMGRKGATAKVVLKAAAKIVKSATKKSGASISFKSNRSRRPIVNAVKAIVRKPVKIAQAAMKALKASPVGAGVAAAASIHQGRQQKATAASKMIKDALNPGNGPRPG